jgi:hypothetical protein
MTDVQAQEARPTQGVATKRAAWLVPALIATLAMAMLSLTALVIVAVTDDETVVTRTETVTNTRVVPISTPTAQDVAKARAMKDEMGVAVGRTVQVADPQTGLTPGQLADALRWRAKAEYYAAHPVQTGGPTYEGLADTRSEKAALHSGDTKNDVP